MRSSSQQEVVEVFDAPKAGMKRAVDLRRDALTTQERLAAPAQRIVLYANECVGCALQINYLTSNAVGEIGQPNSLSVK
jgi:hypothetical protein